ncbi:MAG: YfhO family protein, partial [Chloroflexi bacterium]|nr:YfhO family protein [Chloroflexota bacterium]
ATAVFLLLSLPITLLIWENVPLIDFLQFPWRMVGRAALPIAFLAGVPFTSLQAGKFASGQVGKYARSRITDYGLRIIFYAALILLILEALPMLYPTTCREKLFPTINDVHKYEHASGLVGVDPEGSYFPHTVDRRPKSSALEAAYRAGEPPYRFDETALPEGAAVVDAKYDSLAATIQLTSPAPFTARYLSFDFPGWTVEVDGRSVPITPSDPDGLITFPVPAGKHTVTVRWRSTPLRTALLGFSVMAMAAAAAVTAVILFSNQSSVVSYQLSVNSKQSLVRTDYWSLITDYRLLFLALLLIAFKLLVVDNTETPLRRAGAPPVTHTAVLHAAELRSDGYNLSQTSVESGATFDIDMAWTAVSPPAADYQTNVWLVGPDGLIWSEKGTERPRLYEDAPPTRGWLPGQWAWDSREVQVFSGAPPGQYDIILTLFDKATLQPLTLLGVDGAAMGPTAVIGQITVTRPQEPARFSPQYQMETAVADLSLLGYNQDRAEAAPGDPVLLTLFWEKPTHPPSALSVFKLHLQSESGAIQKTWEIPPVHPDYPPADWQSGERLRGQHALRLPANLNGGIYQFLLNGTPLGEITIHAPNRIFERPSVETAVNIPFYTPDSALQAILTGYNQQPTTNNQLQITLLWQAQTEFPASYRIFVHLVDATGQILAQSDGEPADWTRPTTGWATGEYIADQHTFVMPDPFPDGPLTWRVGLYDPATGQRLLTDTADFAALQFTVD